MKGEPWTWTWTQTQTPLRYIIQSEREEEEERRTKNGKRYNRTRTMFLATTLSDLGIFPHSHQSV
jgi:hypothetical protein